MKWLLAAVMFLVVLLIGGSCETSAQEPGVTASTILNPSVSRFMDLEAGVVCWIYSAAYQGGISCLPISETKLSVEP